MSNISTIVGQLFTNLGQVSDPASATGSANAKLARLLTGTTKIPVVYPILANEKSLVAPTTVWTGYGSYVEIVAAGVLAGHALALIYQINKQALGQNSEYELQLATGTAASEVVIGSWAFDLRTDVGAMPVRPVMPMILIPANARVAGRVSCDNAGGFTLGIKLGFIPIPL